MHRVVCAVDCGRSSIRTACAPRWRARSSYGLTPRSTGEITIEGGRVEQRNFHDYPIVRMDEMPRVDVHIVAHGDPPGGIGEPGTPPIAPAVCNALFALTGKRVRRLPIRTEDLKA